VHNFSGDSGGDEMSETEFEAGQRGIIEGTRAIARDLGCNSVTLSWGESVKISEDIDTGGGSYSPGNSVYPLGASVDGKSEEVRFTEEEVEDFPGKGCFEHPKNAEIRQMLSRLTA
jgi:hypothetical protein